MIPARGHFYQINRVFAQGHDLYPVPGDRHRMLEMGRKRAVGSTHGPPVRIHTRFPGTEVEHRFDTDRHPGLELHPPPGHAQIGNLRLLVHLTADSVADVLSDDPDPVTLADGLN